MSGNESKNPMAAGNLRGVVEAFLTASAKLVDVYHCITVCSLTSGGRGRGGVGDRQTETEIQTDTQRDRQIVPGF